VEPLQRALVDWYRAGHRDLPWRRTRDPYAIWVSEIMLQQTRVETVTPYFERWMARFPSVRALAAAPLDEVLAAWAGLGYYARARHLHAAAREVAARYDGRVPSEPEAVRALPGVGRYTAGAILSLAFGRAEPILDGNVTRVLARLEALDDQPAALAPRLWRRAAQLVPADAAADFNQALMELGATVCTPRAPRCPDCPLASRCAARRSGRPEAFPRARPKRAVPTVRAATVLLEREGRVLLVRRPPAGLWGGLWEPPTGELAAGEHPLDGARRVVERFTHLRPDGLECIHRFDHVLTHRRIRFVAFRARARGRVRLAVDEYQAARWLAPDGARPLAVAAWTARLLARMTPRSVS
jgi:A/G-specific adenine glycosylase